MMTKREKQKIISALEIGLDSAQLLNADVEKIKEALEIAKGLVCALKYIGGA
jgi:hypothetical protein